MYSVPLIYIPMMRSLGNAENLTEQEKKKIDNASFLLNAHLGQLKNMYIDAPIFALRMVSPFHNAVPLIPWL